MSKLNRLHVAPEVEEAEDPCATVKLGDWYWLELEECDTVLVCVMHVGTNFVRVEDIHGNHWRVHFDDFHDSLIMEPDAVAVWARRGAAQQAVIAGIMREINKLTAALSLQPYSLTPKSETQALAQLGTVDVEGYKGELALAKEQLPALFERMGKEHKELARIMTASTLPLRAQAGDLSTLVKAIDARVLNIDLYSGLSEDVEQIRGGEPAAYDEKLCVRQRMLFMDEECLPFYRAGGMKFEDVPDFDRWICDRLDRLLPEPRCVVAFRVRRDSRHYDGPNDISAFISFWYEQMNDMNTYLYIRNGEQVYRLSTKFDFGEQLFPNAAALSTGEELMIRRGSQPIEIVTRREFDMLVERRREGALERREKGRKSHAEPGHSCGPWCWHHDETDEDIEAAVEQWIDGWDPFTPNSVYYDDANAIIVKDVTHYNRVALILQGLFDRSTCLHPHAPVQTWNAEGFNRAIRLVYDDSFALAPANKPDWDAYWFHCNSKLKAGSMTVGQRKQWLLHTRYEHEDRYSGARVRLPGDKGPNEVHEVAKVSRDGKVTYRYIRETNTYDLRAGEYKTAGCRFTCNRSDVFNVDAYRPGDFHRFYDDPRTRREYMQWAGFLLAAEDFKAGKLA